MTVTLLPTPPLQLPAPPRPPLLEFFGPSSLYFLSLGRAYLFSLQAASPLWRPPAPPEGPGPPPLPCPLAVPAVETIMRLGLGRSAAGTSTPPHQCSCWGQSSTGTVLLGGRRILPPEAPQGPGGRGETVRGVEDSAPLRVMPWPERWGDADLALFPVAGHTGSLDPGVKTPNLVTFHEPSTTGLWAEYQADSA